MVFLLIKLILAVIVLGVVVVGIYIAHQGDAVMRFKTAARTKAVKEHADEQRLDFMVEVPYDNIGRQEGTIIDAYMRIYLPQEQYGDVLLRGKVNLKNVLREDDYFEALLVPAGTGNTLMLRFEAYARNGKNITEAMEQISDVDVALFADCRGRGALYTKKEIFTLTAEEMRKLVK